MKKRSKQLILAMLLSGFVGTGESVRAQLPRSFDIAWTTPSANSAQSMPLVGGGIGSNVWVENGDLLFYAQQSGAFDKNGEFLKMGRFRVRFSPSPFVAGLPFKQELKLEEGYIEINGGKLKVKLWLEAKRPVLHVNVDVAEPIAMTVAYESWRYKDVVLAPEERPAAGRRSSLFDFDGYQKDVVKKADVIEPGGSSLLWYQDNGGDFNAFQLSLKTEGLERLEPKLWDPLKNLVSGGLMKCPGLKFTGTSEGTYFQTPYRSWNFASTQKQKHFDLTVYGSIEKTADVAQYKAALRKLADASVDEQKQFTATLQWWKDFWSRSYVLINPDKGETDNGWRVGRNYNIFRYQLGGNTYGVAPTKFNGGNLTTDAGYVNKGYPFDPDYRRWGGWSYTAANQELVYWAYLKSGDFEAMLPQFDVYKNGLGNAEARTLAHFGHDGCSFAEQFAESGMPVASHYGFAEDGYSFFIRPKEFEKGEMSNPWISTLYAGQLNFALMILEYQRFSGREISAYLPFILSALRFYDEHYQMEHRQRTGSGLDGNGKLVIYPSTNGEHHLNSTNPNDAVAGLIEVTQYLLKLPTKMLDASQRAYVEAFQARIPDLPLGTEAVQGKALTFYRASEKDGGDGNSKKPGLTTIFPGTLDSVGSPHFDWALDTWRDQVSEAQKKEFVGWQRSVIYSARLGLTEEAKYTISRKLEDASLLSVASNDSRSHNQSRFPTFWGPGYDWSPDHNWGGGGVIGLQDMLLQTQGNEIRILPAWPKDWDVSYKLWAPNDTSVEVEYRKGRLVTVKVVPESRMKDVVYPQF